ncbi:hypothetical protein AM1_0420 [Acaryochloris marina MBIC11017]|uniref:Uncharacterized protein n=1 Tax=Acaryochloris marina (strain MBIC 11017) TaxID=329726 RepID=B0CAY7_ACAM1|nr:hypothetical protein AM1_0420 [Acaryochloris marina MBIC11017]
MANLDSKIADVKGNGILDTQEDCKNLKKCGHAENSLAIASTWQGSLFSSLHIHG